VDNSNDRAIWSDGTGSMHLIAREGDAAPGLVGALFGDTLGDPVLNHSGGNSFTAILQDNGGGVTSANAATIWREQNGVLGLVARAGSQAPGVTAGTNFSDFSSPVSNNAGKVAFQALLTGFGTGLTSNNGVWSDASGSVALVARQGTTIPGATSGEKFDYFPAVTINDAGKVDFLASYYIGSGGNAIFAGEGIWSNAQGSLKLVARDGMQATGAAAGQNFDFTNSNTLFMNSKGQVAFGARVAGQGTAVWAQDALGVLRAIVLPGDSIDVDNGPGMDSRTVTSATLFANLFNYSSGNEDGRASAFNDLGQVAFIATFTDGSSGVFVSNVVSSVPEPFGLGITLPLLATTVCFRRKRRV
jgi:hypothetical protein